MEENLKNIIKYYNKSNKKCPICNKPIIMEDIVNNKYVFSKTKNNVFTNLFFAHKKCLKRRKKK